MTKPEPARERWERRSEIPLIVAAATFLVAYAVPVVLPDIPTVWRDVCAAVMAVVWVMFLVDYAARLLLSEDKLLFVRRNLLDLAIIALPVLRPLRLIAVLSVLNRTSARTLRGKVSAYLATWTALLLLVGGLAVTEAEQNAPDANIQGIGDGIWWAITTMTTVGYGDRFPVTVTGRLVAILLMMGGIALLGVVTAMIAAWLVERVTAETELEEAATRAQVDALRKEIVLLREQLGVAAMPADPDSQP
jgi:voltage-gated potassium channel